MPEQALAERIRLILQQHGRLPEGAGELRSDSNLYEAGLTSHASIGVMLALENEFDVEFPDHMLSRAIFSNIASIQSALEQLIPA